LSKRSGACVIHGRGASDYISRHEHGHAAYAIWPEQNVTGLGEWRLAMSTISGASTAPKWIVRPSWATKLAAVLGRLLVAYMTWRIERAAIAVLSAMSDRELKDIGLTRGEIASAVSIPGSRVKWRA
jgi:uncharacterized protein YjiS (DUF1127 family)